MAWRPSPTHLGDLRPATPGTENKTDLGSIYRLRGCLQWREQVTLVREEEVRVEEEKEEVRRAVHHRPLQPRPADDRESDIYTRSGKEGHGMESDCPVPWYTRTLVALGIKSHGDPSGPLRQGTFDPLLGVVVTSEGYLSRSESERINNYLECVLNEVKSALGSCAEDVEDEYGCQDTVPPVTQESSSGPGLKTIAAIVLGAASRDACESPQSSQSTSVRGAAYRVSKSDGPGYFHDVGKEALELIRDPFYLQNHVWNSDRKSFHRSNMLNTLFQSLICGSELTTSQNLVKKLMLSFKNDGSFMCFKASVFDHLVDVPVNDPEHGVADDEIPDMEDPNSAQLLVEKLVGPDVNTMLYLPYSLKKSKVEFQLHQPYHGSVLSIGLNNKRMPCLSVSSLCGLQDICLGGVDSLAFGGQLKINESNSWFSVSAGLSVRAELFSAGLTFKQPGQFDYTFCSNILNTSTVLGGLASYSYLTNQWKLIGGIGHTFDPTLNIKGRIGNDKTVNALISKKFAGKGSLHFASEVDLKDFWRYPRVGWRKLHAEAVGGSVSESLMLTDRFSCEVAHGWSRGCVHRVSLPCLDVGLVYLYVFLDGRDDNVRVGSAQRVDAAVGYWNKLT
uniref:Uncharacterized protein n=1 Tax=Aegilops tauschii TaxID=37682 RepID=M8BK72_AEGTA